MHTNTKTHSTQSHKRAYTSTHKHVRAILNATRACGQGVGGCSRPKPIARLSKLNTVICLTSTEPGFETMPTAFRTASRHLNHVSPAMAHKVPSARFSMKNASSKSSPPRRASMHHCTPVRLHVRMCMCRVRAAGLAYRWQQAFGSLRATPRTAGGECHAPVVHRSAQC
jgi:hypothetical protein